MFTQSLKGFQKSLGGLSVREGVLFGFPGLGRGHQNLHALSTDTFDADASIVKGAPRIERILALRLEASLRSNTAASFRPSVRLSYLPIISVLVSRGCGNQAQTWSGRTFPDQIAEIPPLTSFCSACGKQSPHPPSPRYNRKPKSAVWSSSISDVGYLRLGMPQTAAHNGRELDARSLRLRSARLALDCELADRCAQFENDLMEIIGAFEGLARHDGVAADLGARPATVPAMPASSVA